MSGSLAQEITVRLRGDWFGAYGLVRCVAHDDGRPSLRLRDGEETPLLVRCYAGCDARDVLAGLRLAGVLTDDGVTTLSPHSAELAKQREDAAKKRAAEMLAAAARIWRETIEPAGTETETYLRLRGYPGEIPPTIRHHRKLWHKNSGLFLPAMVAVMTRHPGRELSGVHRTYLTHDGRKSPLSHNKKMLAASDGAAVRLAPLDGGEMIVCEGIETGLSLLASTGRPVWAALSAGGMETLILPPPSEQPAVLIAGDNDENGRGQRAADVSARRWTLAGHQVRIALPPVPGKDWNDVACEAPADV
jgi:phage/plasmid primase-like uncharacterized protein